jgi:hypothetical protein
VKVVKVESDDEEDKTVKKIVKKVKVEDDEEPAKKDAKANLKKAIAKTEVESDDEIVVPKKATKKPECTNSPFVKIADIESQINSIIQILPEIKSVSRKTGLVKTITPEKNQES